MNSFAYDQAVRSEALAMEFEGLPAMRNESKRRQRVNGRWHYLSRETDWKWTFFCAGWATKKQEPAEK